jgi:hypothetical protein
MMSRAIFIFLALGLFLAGASSQEDFYRDVLYPAGGESTSLNELYFVLFCSLGLAFLIYLPQVKNSSKWLPFRRKKLFQAGLGLVASVYLGAFCASATGEYFRIQNTIDSYIERYSPIDNGQINGPIPQCRVVSLFNLSTQGTVRDELDNHYKHITFLLKSFKGSLLLEPTQKLSALLRDHYWLEREDIKSRIAQANALTQIDHIAKMGEECWEAIKKSSQSTDSYSLEQCREKLSAFPMRKIYLKDKKSADEVATYLSEQASKCKAGWKKSLGVAPKVRNCHLLSSRMSRRSSPIENFLSIYPIEVALVAEGKAVPLSMHGQEFARIYGQYFVDVFQTCESTYLADIGEADYEMKANMDHLAKKTIKARDLIERVVSKVEDRQQKLELEVMSSRLLYFTGMLDEISE